MAVTFSELTKQVHVINDIILTDMICDHDGDPAEEEALNFKRHLLATKHWFSRVSYANKKRYILALLEDVHSAWALSLLLKSMWNCRPKDAVLSVSESNLWSSYDQVPIDHNRTAIPLTVLAQVMKDDRMWFLVQEPEAQAMVLAELLTIAGGPVMWVVLRRAQYLYERYRNDQLHNLQECVVVHEPIEKPALPAAPSESQSDNKKKPIMAKSKDGLGKNKSSTFNESKTNQNGRAQIKLEANVNAWNATIKSMKDSLKLEEFEMTFNDGHKQKIWKVNRQKPEAIETVDFVQLLPSSISKRIMSFLPRAQLAEYARVNKYWSYLVDEFKAELAARLKIDVDYEKLHDLMLRHDVSLEIMETYDMGQIPPSSQGGASTALSMKMKPPPSMRSRGASEKSGGAYSLRNFLNEKLKTPIKQAQRPIRNMAELIERLESRGAADENLWKWCDNIIKHSIHLKKSYKTEFDGILQLGNAHFPCPMMKHTIDVPLSPPLFKDPASTRLIQPRRNISSMLVPPQSPRDRNIKRYSLWTKDFSGLYPVMKIPSYQSPFKNNT